MGENRPEMTDPRVVVLIKRVVKEHRHLFWHFRGCVGGDDLVQECVAEIVRAWSSYKTERSAWTTWVWAVCRGTLLDLHRAMYREARRQVVRAISADCTVSAPQELDDDLHSWVARTHRQARRLSRDRPERVRRGAPSRYSSAQKATLMALKLRTRSSVRGLHLLLDEHPGLCQAMELETVPSVWTFCRMFPSRRKELEMQRQMDRTRSGRTADVRSRRHDVTGGIEAVSNAPGLPASKN